MVELPQEVSVKTSQQFEDLKLIRRSQAGDADAFGELVTKYRTKIFTMVFGMVHNEHDAWDLAQEGFLKAWQSIRRFEGRSSFYTWLYSITVNLTIYSLRRKGHREVVELNDAIPSSLPCPGVNYQCTEIRAQVNAALAKLSPEHRAVVVLKELEENGAKISIAFVEDGGELHAFYDGVLSGMDKPWGGVSWLLARNG